LTQPTQSVYTHYVYMALFLLQRSSSTHPRRVHSLRKTELVAGDLKYRNQREVSVESELLPNVKYVLFVSTYRPGEESPFLLTVHARHRFVLEQMDSNVTAD